MFSFRSARSQRRCKPRVTRLVSEQLETRSLFAADIGNHCLEWAVESSQSTEPSFVSESSSRSSSSKTISPTAAAGSTKPAYTYSLIGSNVDKTGTNNSALAIGGLAIMGGGTDVDAAFRWMGQRANGGDFVILSASSTSYGRYINSLSTLNSVETLVVPSLAAANDPKVADIVSKAEAIFITGGDQANYVKNWSGTLLETAIYDAMLNNNAVLGGTSAGLAVMGEVDFAALNGTISSSEALSNPNDSRITLDKGFITLNDTATQNKAVNTTPLKYLDNTLLESHFQQRDRMGRAMAFTANMAAGNMQPAISGDAIATPRTIAVNEQTALLVEPSGNSSVVGNPYSSKLPVASQRRSVFFINGTTSITTEGPLTAPLSYSVSVGRFDWNPTTPKYFPLNTWAPVDANASYTINANTGILASTATTLYG